MNRTPYPVALARPPLPSWKSERAASIGSHAAESTSHTRKIRIPTAIAFSMTRRFGTGRFRRAIGRPSRMVTPAMKPSNSVFSRLNDRPFRWY